MIKIDVLNVSIYKDVKDTAHMDRLVAQEPIWELLAEEEFCDLLFHMRGHHNVCKQMKPTSIEQLAAILALIRPAKRHLIGKSWNTIMRTIWDKPKDDAYYFKKSHAMGYALAVVLHMNLITEQFTTMENT